LKAAVRLNAHVQHSATITTEQEPVDVVFTYVDDQDPNWYEDFKRHEAEAITTMIPVRDGKRVGNRWRNWNELMYSMRSVYMYANWVRHIYIVVAYESQIPQWLDRKHERIRIVLHQQIFDKPEEQLPTFNSLAIETVLHRIKGLSENFLYMNNDVFFGRNSSLSNFKTNEVYYRFTHWPMNLITGICITYLKPSRELPDERMRRRCSRFQFFWDRVLTVKHWRFLDNVWFAHTPHLWEKRALLKIEETLSKQIAACRRNRFRDPTIDVTMHLQYEALLRSEWAHSKISPVSRLKRLPLEDGHVPLRVEPLALERTRQYLWSTFTTASDPHVEVNVRKISVQYLKMEKQMQYRPLFFGVDDDLKLASEAEFALHRRYFTEFMRKHWHVQAPWELTNHKFN
jgi:hypothetical protein